MKTPTPGTPDAAERAAAEEAVRELVRAAKQMHSELSWMLSKFPERRGGAYEDAVNAGTAALAAFKEDVTNAPTN